MLAILGGVKFTYLFLTWIYWKITACVDLKKYLYGYVLITGATDGIGKALTKDFLRRGFKVIMVSRSIEKLEKTKQEFKEIFPDSEIDIIAVDFTYSHRDSMKFYEDLHNKIKGYNISVLVNNVGVSYAQTLITQPLEHIENIIGNFAGC